MSIIRNRIWLKNFIITANKLKTNRKPSANYGQLVSVATNNFAFVEIVGLAIWQNQHACMGSHLIYRHVCFCLLSLLATGCEALSQHCIRHSD